jgi:hypothetical protein
MDYCSNSARSNYKIKDNMLILLNKDGSCQEKIKIYDINPDGSIKINNKFKSLYNAFSSNNLSTKSNKLDRLKFKHNGINYSIKLFNTSNKNGKVIKEPTNEFNIIAKQLSYITPMVAWSVLMGFLIQDGKLGDNVICLNRCLLPVCGSPSTYSSASYVAIKIKFDPEQMDPMKLLELNNGYQLAFWNDGASSITFEGSIQLRKQPNFPIDADLACQDGYLYLYEHDNSVTSQELTVIREENDNLFVKQNFKFTYVVTYPTLEQYYVFSFIIFGPFMRWSNTSPGSVTFNTRITFNYNSII